MTTMTMTMMLAGAVILGAAVFADLALREASSSLRHLVWTSALGALLLVPLVDASGVRVELPVPAGWLEGASATSGAERPEAGPVTADRRETRTIRVTQMSTGPVTPDATAGTARSGSRAWSAAAAALPAGGTAAPTPDRYPRSPRSTTGSGLSAGRAGTGESVVVPSSAISVSGASAFPRPVAALGAVWLLGALLLLSATLFAQLAAHRATVRGVRPAARHVRDRLAVLAFEVGQRRPIRLVVSRELAVPATWGLFTPTIVLPEQHHAWSRATLDRVLLHELAHIRRGDCWTLLVGELARAVHWPNPLAWLAVRRQRFESERACDDRVLARGGAPSDYASDLVDIARALARPDRTPRAVLAMAEPVGMPARVRSILQADRPRRHVGAFGVSMASTATFLLGFAFAGVVPVAQAQERPDHAVSVPEPLDPVDPIDPINPIDPVAPVAPVDAFEPIPPLAPLPALEPPRAFDRPQRVRTLASVGTSLGVRAAAAVAGWTDLRVALIDTADLVGALATPTSAQERCRFTDGGRRSTSINSDDDRYRVRWETDSCRVEIDMEGRILFADDDTGIAEMADGAVLDIEERVGRTSRRARMEGNGRTIERDYWVDGDRTEWNAEADRWLASILPELFRHTTINAEARVRRFLRQGGPNAVFAEVDQMRSDHVRRTYLELLVQQADLGEAEYVRIIDTAAGFDSDHATTELLLAIVEEQGLRPVFQEPILRAAARIDSDHQKGRLLGALLASDLSADQLDAVLRTARTVDSDHQLGVILSQVAKDGGLTTAGRASYMAALSSIESDHQQTVVLGAFLDAGQLTTAELGQVLEMTRSIESDHQRAMVLQRVADEYPLTGDQVTVYLEAASAIESDHQLATTATRIVRRAEFTSEHVGLVLAMADRVESDHQTAQILAAIIERRSLTPSEVDRLLDATSGIESDHQLGSTLISLIDDEELGPDQVLHVLDAARRIGSDHNQSMVLVRLAERHEVEGEALGTYRDLAERMSRHQRDQTLAAIARRPMR